LSKSSPVCLVKRKVEAYRFCVDYRPLNAVTKRDSFPVSNNQDAIDNLKFKPMTDKAKERSAFCTRRGLYQFSRMSFGLCNSPATLCRLMHRFLGDYLWQMCFFYVDDIILFGSTQRELLQRFNLFLNRLRDVGLKVKLSKCSLFQTQVAFLSHLVSEHGIDPMPDKLQAIKDWLTPQCLRDGRAFYGLASYYRCFVREFATKSEAFTRLMRKNATFCWTPEAQQTFDSLKDALCNAVTLAVPSPGQTVILDTDASDVSYGGILSTYVDGVECPIAFMSRVFNSAQRNYCPIRRELLAVVAALQRFCHFLLGVYIILRTDHYSLKWLRTFKRPEGMLAR